jgi:hypothetical protein
MLQVGKKGRIIKGMSPDQFVFVEADPRNNGGFRILIAINSDLTLWFDNYVKDWEALERFWQEVDWEVEWLE